MSALELKVYDILKSRFSEKEASVVIEYVEEMVNDGVEKKVVHSQALQSKDLELLRKEVGEKSAETNLKIAESKSEMIKWMFIFWIGQVTVTVGLILIYLKK
jgi:hypothetical protein